MTRLFGCSQEVEKTTAFITSYEWQEKVVTLWHNTIHWWELPIGSSFFLQQVLSWQSMLAVTNTFVVTKVLSPQAYFVMTKLLSWQTCLLQQKFCRNKHIFVATKDVFCRNKQVSLSWQNFCHNKIISQQIVVTKLLSQQAYICHNKRHVLLWRNTSFVATKICLLWQNFCHDKHMFGARKVLSWQKILSEFFSCLWQLPQII